jgi:hypothetical protein
MPGTARRKAPERGRVHVADGATPIEYEPSMAPRRAPILIRVGAASSVVAGLMLLAAIFIRNGGRYWGPYLYPPVTIDWADPFFFGSMLSGLVGVFASGLGAVRPAAVGWKVVAVGASAGYLVGFVCVVLFRML